MSRSRTSLAVLVAALVAGFVWLAWRPAQPASSVPSPDVAGAVASPSDSVASPVLVEFAAPREAAERIVADAVVNADAATASPDPAVPSTTIHLRVLHKGTDQPIAGARVTTFEDSAVGVRETDASGACEFRVPRSSEPMLLRVDREGFFHVKANCERREELEVRLHRTTVLSGRVLAADTGTTIPRARVSLVHNYCKRCEPDVVVASSEGAFEIGGVPLRDEGLCLLFQAAGFPDQSRRFEIRSDDPRVEQDFRLERGFEIAGRVTDFQSGIGISSAHIGEILTDASGEFHGRVLPELDRSEIELRVEAQGYSQLVARVTVENLSARLEFRLPRGCVVDGTVRNIEGAPVFGAVVSVSEDPLGRIRAKRNGIELPPTPLGELPDDWRIEPEGYHCVGKSDENGQFRLETVVPWNHFLVLSCSAEGYFPDRRAIEQLRGPGETTWAELVLERSLPEGHVQGVVYLNGAKLWTATGRLHWKSQNHAGETSIERGEFGLAMEPCEVACQVEIDGLPPGIEGSEFVTRIEAGTTLESKVELQMAEAQICGRVTFRDGSPAVGSEVRGTCRLRDDGDNWWECLHVSTQVDASGGYCLKVPDWTRVYRVTAVIYHDESSVDGIPAGAQNIDLALTLPGRILFRVFDAATEKPIDHNLLEFQWRRSGEKGFRDFEFRPSPPDADGWYESWLPSGQLDLQARDLLSDRRPCLIHGIWVPATGDVPKVEFPMENGLELLLRLAGDEERLPEKNRVFLVEEADWDGVQYDEELNSWLGGNLGSGISRRTVRFEEGGTAKISGLAPGRFRFKVFPPEFAVEPEYVEIEDDQPAPVEIRWRRVE